MPCSKNKEHDQQGRRNTFRSTFSRTFTGFRYSDQHNLEGLSIAQPAHSHHNHHHHHLIDNEAVLHAAPHSSNSEVDDLADQLRISVQEAHIIQRSFINDFGGNITAVFDNCDDTQQPYTANYERQSQHLEYIPSAQNDPRLNQPSNETRSIAIADHQIPTTSSQTYVDPHQSTSFSSALVRVSGPSTLLNDSATNAHQSNIVIESNKSNVDCQSEDFDPQACSSNLKCVEYLSSPDEHNHDDCLDYRSDQTISAENRSEDNIAASKQDTELIKRYEYDSPAYFGQGQVGVIKTNLCNGSSFSGFQESRNESYQVNVKIQYIDYENNHLSGYLTIYNLTKSHPSLTTFFEGEIISEQYPFHTRKWDATEEIDLAHWSKFEGFQKFTSTFNTDHFDYEKLKNSDSIFMRWKEHFLVPDYTVKQVDGASYEGFYYICYSKRTSSISGYYFHINTRSFESFQSLNLQLDEPCVQGATAVFEFR